MKGFNWFWILFLGLLGLDYMNDKTNELQARLDDIESAGGYSLEDDDILSDF